MRFSRLCALALVLVGVAGATGQTTAPADWPLRIRPVDSPAGADSGQPQMTVSPRGVLLSWVERAGATATLKFAERTATGWSPAVTVAAGTDWFVNWADIPSVLRLDDGALAAHWLQKSGTGTYAYDVRLSVSADDGRTWAPSFSPHHDGTQTEHGFVSLVQMPGAWLGLVWLDGRHGQTRTNTGHGRTPTNTDEHGPRMNTEKHGPRMNTEKHGQGAMSLRFAAFDRSLKQVADVAIDDRVCECCPTSAVAIREGLLTAYRNRSEDEVRDIHVARYETGRWSPPAPVHADNWRIAACPVNGPALSARGRAVAAAWFTVKDDAGHAFVAFSDDDGRTFGTPVRLDDYQSTGRVDIELLPDGSAAVSYLEVTERGGSQFRVRRVDRSGMRSPAITVAGVESGRTSGYPRLALHGSELVFAWLARDRTIGVRTAVAALP
ncbi:MAG TPA: hypothetical protein VD833_05525 [Vicinamibacterales bacterium]|nr:hypothetical protein [Vicinamibacterales bacterium]